MSTTPSSGRPSFGLSVPDLSSLLIDEVLRTLVPEDTSPSLSIPRIASDDELYEYTLNTLGVKIPRLAVKQGHVAPFTAFAEAYFARSPVAVWLGARGLAGKTYMLATLGWVEAVTLRANVSILGGSSDQSEKVLEYLTSFWLRPNAPTAALESEPSARRVKLIWGNQIKALAASQKQARGGHPQRLRCDEIDEMDWKLLKAVMGQPMGSSGIESQTVLSSTHHNPEGTMTKVLELAQEKGWPVYQWGYPETLEPHGWLTRHQLERKRVELTSETWRVEVEMGEPSTEGRAIMEEKVEAMFTGPDITVQENEEREFEEPVEGAYYATGADWGQTTDFTEIVTFRTDVRPLRLVAYRYMRRRPYPEMVAKLDARLARYPGEAAHDYTGVGRVGEFLEAGNIEDVTMVGRVRTDLFLDYVLAVERGELRSPRITRLYRQHKYCVRRGSLVTAARGDVPIEQLVPGELVLTRAGWRAVLHVTRVGRRPIVRLTLNDGRTIDITQDHLIATEDGWSLAGDCGVGRAIFTLITPAPRLIVTDTTPAATLGIDDQIRSGVGMPLRTMRRAGMSSAPALASHDIHAMRDSFQMVGITAGWDAAQMVQFTPVRHRTTAQLIGEDMGDARGGPADTTPAIPLGIDMELPQPTPVLIDADTGADVGQVGGFALRHVTHSTTPYDDEGVEVWDIGVEGEPEFIANGFVVHNCRTKDLYGHGEDCHPPDGVVACAMANKAGSTSPVRLLFAQTTEQQVRTETTAGLGKAASFLRRPTNGHGGNGAIHP